MDRKIIFGIIITVIIVAFLVIISQLPGEELPQCADDDGVCPAGCKFDLDNDCIETGTISLGEVKSCLSSADCVVIEPICGNLLCSFTKKQCKSDQFCEVSINKNFVNVWNNNEVECSNPEPVCGNQELQSTCISGECRVKF